MYQSLYPPHNKQTRNHVCFSLRNLFTRPDRHIPVSLPKGIQFTTGQYGATSFIHLFFIFFFPFFAEGVACEMAYSVRRVPNCVVQAFFVIVGRERMQLEYFFFSSFFPSLLFPNSLLFHLIIQFNVWETQTHRAQFGHSKRQ